MTQHPGPVTGEDITAAQGVANVVDSLIDQVLRHVGYASLGQLDSDLWGFREIAVQEILTALKGAEDLRAALHEALCDYKLSNMREAGDPDYPYPLIDLCSNEGTDISTGREELLSLADYLVSDERVVTALQGERPAIPRERAVAGVSEEDLARRFHETYERLAPSFGYETREESAKPWADVPEQNKRLMIAVCGEILVALAAPDATTCFECAADLIGPICPTCNPLAAPDVEWRWLADNPGVELSWGEIDGDPSDCAWRVHQVNGGVNDREWTLIATGETPLEAVRAALRQEGGE